MFRISILWEFPPLVNQHAKRFRITIPVLPIRMMSDQVYYNNQLVKILQNHIFGVDLNEEAVRIASFSLSLVMCDYLEPRSIWETLVFPRLLSVGSYHRSLSFLSGQWKSCAGRWTSERCWD